VSDLVPARLRAAALAAALVAVFAGAACSSHRPLPPVSGAGAATTSDPPPPTATAIPAPTASPPAATPTPAAATSTTTRPPPPSRTFTYRFPVPGNASYARTHHDYPASDIIAACGTPVVAPVAGKVLDTSTVDRFDPKVNDGATRGGLSVSILGADGVRYYGSHFANLAPGIAPGVAVTAGQRLGQVGRTGNASACHLHFGISPPCQRVGDWWIQRGVVWPWSYLDSWRQGGNLSPAAVVSRWRAQHGCPASA
jgi:murein DD-endopeptidase MepM/ murein hydrolase activator NlpD